MPHHSGLPSFKSLSDMLLVVEKEHYRKKKAFSHLLKNSVRRKRQAFLAKSIAKNKNR
jgi:hypothetical protein